VRAPQIILNMGRQVGKSTVIAALALHTCLYKPGSLVIVIAPSQRQSRELFIKIADFLGRLEPAEKLEEETKLSLTLSNRSRVVVLPGDNARTVRGYSAPELVIEDEAAFVADETYDASLPMLAATSTGRIGLMSTPYVASGHFYHLPISTLTAFVRSWQRLPRLGRLASMTRFADGRLRIGETLPASTTTQVTMKVAGITVMVTAKSGATVEQMGAATSYNSECVTYESHQVKKTRRRPRGGVHSSVDGRGDAQPRQGRDRAH
jgi:hypothetical protein